MEPFMELSRSRAMHAVGDLIAEAAPEAHTPRFLTVTSGAIYTIT
jgi:hypothetical protein